MQRMTKSSGNLIDFIKSSLFLFFERYLSIHVTPVHYYSPVPAVSDLNSRTFAKIYSDTGMNWNLEGPIKLLQSMFPIYSNEYKPLQNTGLTLIDSFILYAMIRKRSQGTEPLILYG